MKTRKELEKSGKLLMGPIVPDKLKPNFDGCSVPWGLNWILNAEEARSACYIHDFHYYVMSILFPKGSNDLRLKEMRMMADYQLKINRTMIAKKGFKRIYGFLYFKAVRFGGDNILKHRTFHDIIPPVDAETLDEVFDIIDEEYFITSHSEKVWDEWKKTLDNPDEL